MSKHPAEAYQRISNEAERERILMDELPQVRYIARRIHERLPRHVPFEDLVHAGVLGLIDALGKFDQSKHVQFSSYAKFRIRGAILDSLRELDWSPRELRRKGREVEAAYAQLSARLGRTPGENDLAREMGIPLEELQALLAELDSLEISSLRVESPHSGKEELLAAAIAELPEKEQRVLSLYYFEELTMKEVGAVLGIGESRVSQIHSLAMVRLRTRLSFLNESGNAASAKSAGM